MYTLNTVLKVCGNNELVIIVYCWHNSFRWRGKKRRQRFSPSATFPISWERIDTTANMFPLIMQQLALWATTSRINLDELGIKGTSASRTSILYDCGITTFNGSCRSGLSARSIESGYVLIILICCQIVYRAYTAPDREKLEKLVVV